MALLRTLASCCPVLLLLLQLMEVELEDSNPDDPRRKSIGTRCGAFHLPGTKIQGDFGTRVPGEVRHSDAREHLVNFNVFGSCHRSR